MSEVLRLEEQYVKAKKLVAQRDMALKLNKNTDFRKLILEEFCVQECARYAQMSADFSLPPENRADALALAQAAGHIRKWLSVQVQMGNTAERDLEQIDAAIEEARIEEDEAK